MKVLTDLIERIESSIEGLPDMAIEVVDETKETLEELNTSQLQEGERADGTTLPDYSPRSVSEFGKPPGPMKMLDTGDFYEGIQVKTFKDKFELIGLDPKTNMLEKNYGKLVGLQSDKLQEYTDFIFRPGITEKFRNKILR
jgi:hypothetical protein